MTNTGESTNSHASTSGQKSVTKESVRDLIYEAIDRVNKQAAKTKNVQLEKDMGTVLFGSASQLDSLGLINLIVATEENLENRFGLVLTLADERALSQKESPFRTVASLVDYIYLLMTEKNSES
ncbi:MAG: acyl carrier protein [Bdellovibrionales bacterium]